VREFTRRVPVWDFFTRLCTVQSPGAAESSKEGNENETNRSGLYTLSRWTHAIFAGFLWRNVIARHFDKAAASAANPAYGIGMAWRNYQKAVPEEPPYCLKSIEPTDGPEGGEGDWFSYVIEQGDNQITGMRAGEESVIRRELGEMIERLNERRNGKNRSKSKAKAQPVAKPAVVADASAEAADADADAVEDLEADPDSDAELDESEVGDSAAQDEPLDNA
jgi:hypothetical protein